MIMLALPTDAAAAASILLPANLCQRLRAFSFWTTDVPWPSKKGAAICAL